MIQSWQPWNKSTGPRTAQGRAKAAQNAFKGGIRPQLRLIARVLRKQRKSQLELSEAVYDAMAETVVAAALDGHFGAIQEIARAIDEEPERVLMRRLGGCFVCATQGSDNSLLRSTLRL